MKAVIQRVNNACVRIENEIYSQIGNGLLILVGCEKGDNDAVFQWVADKIVDLRIFPDGDNHFEKSVKEINGEILVVSQFTLLGSCRKGRRPSFSDAMPVEEARTAFQRFVELLSDKGVTVRSGKFQAVMEIESKNFGPVTLIVEKNNL